MHYDLLKSKIGWRSPTNMQYWYVQVTDVQVTDFGQHKYKWNYCPLPDPQPLRAQHSLADLYVQWWVTMIVFHDQDPLILSNSIR